MGTTAHNLLRGQHRRFSARFRPVPAPRLRPARSGGALPTLRACPHSRAAPSHASGARPCVRGKRTTRQIALARAACFGLWVQQEAGEVGHDIEILNFLTLPFLAPYLSSGLSRVHRHKYELEIRTGSLPTAKTRPQVAARAPEWCEGRCAVRWVSLA